MVEQISGFPPTHLTGRVSDVMPPLDRYEHRCLLLVISEKGTPSGRQIERGLDGIVSKTKSKGGIVPTVRYIGTALSYLTTSLIFHFPDFNLTSRQEIRLKISIDKLLKDGRLTKNRRERHWVGVVLVTRMAITYLTFPSDAGTSSWD